MNFNKNKQKKSDHSKQIAPIAFLFQEPLCIILKVVSNGYLSLTLKNYSTHNYIHTEPPMALPFIRRTFAVHFAICVQICQTIHAHRKSTFCQAHFPAAAEFFTAYRFSSHIPDFPEALRLPLPG